MSKKILSTYLKSFSEDEKASFLDYLNSPMFPITNRSRSIETYNYLIKQYAPAFESKEIDIELIQKKLGFTNVKNIFTSLIQSIEDFLSVSKYLNQRHDQAIYLLQVLKEKDLNEIFTKRVKGYLNDDWQNIGYAQEKYFHLYRIYKELNRSYSIDKFDASEDSLYHLHKYHDLQYTLIKIKALSTIQTQRNTVNKQIETSEYLEVVEKIESSEDANFMLQLYILIFRYIKETDRETLKKNYFKLKELYFDNIEDIPRKDKIDVFIGLNNYCQKIHRLEENGFMKEVYALYRLGYEHQTLFLNDIIEPILFYNIVQVASEVSEIEWAEEFVENSKSKLPRKFQEPISQIAKAYIFSSSNRCSEALTILAQVEFMDIFFALRAKIITIKCYYELKEMYALDNFLKTFQNYIRRQKQLSDVAKDRYLKFSSIVGKLMKTNSSSEKKAIESAVLDDDKLIFKSWLARMANQL